ncbi:DUF3991 and TOPRIM domain-containing protein [Anaeromicropila herbilytica]|uniref:DUF3991 domain-containing protein n=1 Tax=Anaeromicropila herbilytica TaxID=2785025 RepID=A0A7R7IBE4_9FIRM|nr:DUF3991 and TOPRIM domain-containing protein [Anaeromicropila herbilytica]BCN29512.1 hypothetical protein bsdtb5_08070 [Anaeromicropila herbilytica]
MRFLSDNSYKRFSKEQVERADHTNIYDLALQRGYAVRNINTKLAEIRSQGGLDIDKLRNRWYCHSADDGGGPIQLLVFMEGFTWIEAVKELLNEEGEYKIYAPVEDVVEEYQKENFKLPEKNNTYKHVFAYLIKTRKIHQDIVNEFVDKKLIYENDKKSCVFVGYDNEEKVRYASIRSTSTAANAFRGEAKSSDKRFGFARRGSNHILTIMEAPIDLLSYLTLYKIHGLEKLIENDHLLSLGGVCDKALKQYLYDHPEITTIKIGLDNDKAGNKASSEIIQEYSSQYQVKRLRIKGKDFNEMLIQDVNEQIATRQIKNMEMKQQVDEEENELELA